jgi:hypothetical protein
MSISKPGPITKQPSEILPLSLNRPSSPINSYAIISQKMDRETGLNKLNSSPISQKMDRNLVEFQAYKPSTPITNSPISKSASIPINKNEKVKIDGGKKKRTKKSKRSISRRSKKRRTNSKSKKSKRKY